MEKEEQPIRSDPDDKFERYLNRGTKIRDLWIGILGGLGYLIIASILILVPEVGQKSRVMAILIALYIGAIIYFFYKKRTFLAIGLIAIVTVPPAVIGGCLYLTS